MNSQKSHTLCILHDTFIYQGGAERLMIMMARALSADLASAYFDVGSFDPRVEGVPGQILSLGKRWKNRYLSQLKLQFDFAFRTKFLRQYDTVILSGDCLSAVRNIRKDARVLYYCHTPPRYLFDQCEAYEKKVTPILRPLYRLYISFMRKKYLSSLERVDVIYTNSLNTQKRIKDFVGRESIIIYPPVDIDFFVPASDRGEYYFSYTRLSTIKRVDMVVRAFQKIPDKKLVIHHGINDPQKGDIELLVKGYPNIELVQLQTQDELVLAIARSTAVVYIPENEDFGMIPLEAMSCGVPVIGVDDGGLKETIIHEKTGWLLTPESLEQDMIQLITGLQERDVLAMRDACLEQAGRFSLTAFEKQVRQLFLS